MAGTPPRAVVAVQDSAPEDSEWVPLPDGPEEHHVDSRLRCVFDEGRSMVQARVWRWDHGALFMGIPGNTGWVKGSGEWFIHKDDVDRLLVEKVAAAIWDAAREGDDPPQPWEQSLHKREYRRWASVALAVVRAEEA